MLLVDDREAQVGEGHILLEDGVGADEDLDVAYRAMERAYRRVFARCGLRYTQVEADTGNIGGSESHEFMVLADTGEDDVVFCDACDYAANREKATSKVAPRRRPPMS